MNQLHLKGNNGFVRLILEPATGGRASIEVENWNFRAQGKVWLGEGDLARFVADLRRCYDGIDGVAELESTCDKLKLSVIFDRPSGQVRMEAALRDDLSLLRTLIESDQSYIGQALPEA
jgi:hypothetical protein